MDDLLAGLRRHRRDVEYPERAPRPGQPRPQHGPDEAGGPGDDDDGHALSPLASQPGHGRVPGHVRTLFISWARIVSSKPDGLDTGCAHAGDADAGGVDPGSPDAAPDERLPPGH